MFCFRRLHLRRLRLRLLSFLQLIASLLFLVYLAWINGFLSGNSWKAHRALGNAYKKIETHHNENDRVNFQGGFKTVMLQQLMEENKTAVRKLSEGRSKNSVQLNLQGKVSGLIKLSSESKTAHTIMPCDQECVKFRSLLRNWPQGKPKAAVYYLAKSDRLSRLNSSLTSLYHSFLCRFNYPVIVFHEADARDVIRWKFRNYAKIKLFFQEILFEIPAHVDTSAVKFNIKCMSHIGYRHMCYFHAKLIYSEPILVGLEYVWRLDDDSLLPASISYDLFDFMRDHGLKYGYVKIHVDSYDCTAGLWNAVRHYMKSKNLESQNFEKWAEPKIFYNNFEISELSVWMSREYQEYINFVDSLGGIFYYRWGDAPIKSIAVMLFLPQNATHLFSDITYQHGNFFTNMSYSTF